MRGNFKQESLEYVLNIQGESWKQGDFLAGNLIIKNNGNKEIKVSEPTVLLAYGDNRKIKAKKAKAFQTIAEQSFTYDKNLAVGEECRFSWRFHLDTNCSITDNAGSLYVLCGTDMHLQLNVETVGILAFFLEIFENFFRFKVKALKNKQGFIEAKMSSPNSKDMGAIEQLKMLMRINNEDGQDNLQFKYKFKVNKLAYQHGNVSAIKVELDLEQNLTPKQYTMFGGVPDQDLIIKAINEIMDEVKKKTKF